MNWTFGIVTHSETQIYLDAVIDSIHALNIPDVDIVVVGGIAPDKGEYHIPFDETEKSNWITRKKNLIAENAKYENMVVTHDYVGFTQDWYTNFVKFGEDWDVCMNRILNTDNRRFRDWVSFDAVDIFATWIQPSFIPYADHSRTKRMYASGTYFCVKRSFLCQHPLDEGRSWGQGEDCEWSCRVREFWNYRCNPRSIVQFLKPKPHFPEPTAEDEFYDTSDPV